MSKIVDISNICWYYSDGDAVVSKDDLDELVEFKCSNCKHCVVLPSYNDPNAKQDATTVYCKNAYGLKVIHPEAFCSNFISKL